MKRKILYSLYFLIMLFGLGSIVFAEGECTLEARSDLRGLASNINIVYQEVSEYVKNEDYEEGDIDADPEYLQKYLVIKIYNLSPHLRLEMTYGTPNDSTSITYNQADQDGVITLVPSTNEYVITYTFNVYGSSSACYGQLLRTIKLTLPKYNYYSERSVCDDIPDYFMCQTYTTYDINPTNFLDSVNAYKEKLKTQKNEIDENGDVKDNTSIINKTASVITKYKYVIIGVILVIGVVVTIIIVKNKRRVL